MTCRVLIAEDSEMTRKALAKMLALNGFEVVGLAEDGEQVVKLYRKLRPDIVLMDIAMPRKHGIDATLDILRFDPRAKIVAVTALYTRERRDEVMEAGALAIVTKPFDLGDLLKVIREALGAGE